MAQGVGMARQRHAILEGMKADVEQWSDVEKMDPHNVIALMLQTQYYSTLRELGEGAKSTVFIPTAPSNVSHLTEQIRDGIMMSDARRSALASVNVEKKE